MAITYKLDDQRVSFHWDKESDLWTAKSDDIKDLDLAANSFSSIIKLLSQKHPELSNSIRIFFPDTAKSLALA